MNDTSEADKSAAADADRDDSGAEQMREPAEETTDTPVEDAAADAARFERKWQKRESPRPAASSEAEVPRHDSNLDGDLQRQTQRADDLYDRLQRAMADLSNYRKRAEYEREEMTRFANMLLVADLLPVLDNFERALQSIPSSLMEFTWLQGIALVERQLRGILERQGLAVIEAQGQPFNAALHEAIVEEPTTEHAPGTVVEELQRGYTMHGRVLRPTLAKVAAKPEVAEPEAAESPAAEDEPVSPTSGTGESA